MIKKLILLLVVLAVLVFGDLNWGGNQGQEEADSGSSGGTSGGMPKPEEMQMPAEAITSGEVETPV